MFKPHTIEQFKVMCYINEQFVKGSVVVSPDSRTALKVTDNVGDSLVFDYRDGRVLELEERSVPSLEERRAYIKRVKTDPNPPVFQCLEDIVRWWHEEDRPISFQQALNLSDIIFQYYLTHEITNTEDARLLACKGRVTEEEYLAIQLWYLDGNFKTNWLGPFGVDGTGESYELVLDYRLPTEQRFRFYVMDEYYHAMNGQ